ncbi:MAG: hypothetical protein K1X94_34565 [Sandaracinaceae bacterium]|nr:hypothetical protein [Sandaracinaceae bacterium]
MQRKLEALMGDHPVSPTGPARRQRTSTRATKAERAPAETSERATGKRTRVPESHMAELRARVLSAMPVGEPLKRARIVELARVSEDDEPRVAAVLRKLKDEGILQMRGTKASAVYTRRG